MRAALAAGTLALLIAGTACGERTEPTGVAVPIYPVTVTDATDRQVTTSREPSRIAALNPASEEILRGFGLGKRLVGPPEGFFGPKGELIVSRLRQARPDLIVASPDSDGIEKQVTALGAPVYFAPQGSIEEVERAITQIGLLVDRPVAARGLVHTIEVRRALVAAQLKGIAPVSVFVDTGFFITIPDQSLIGSIVAEAHGRNVAGANPAAGPFDLRDLVRLDPDVYLATSDSDTTLAALRKDPRTRKLRAVRNRRLVLVDVALLAPGPRVGEGLLAVARLLHPDAFR